MTIFLILSVTVAAFFFGYYIGLVYGHVVPACVTTVHAATWSNSAVFCAICLVFLLGCLVIEVVR